MIQIEINEKPVSWMAPKQGKHLFYNPRGEEKNKTQWIIRSQYRERPVENPVILIFNIYFAFPKNISAKKKLKMLNGKIIPTRMDLSNMIKFYEDCLKGIVIEDDRYVAGITAQKNYDEKDKILITILPLNL